MQHCQSSPTFAPQGLPQALPLPAPPRLRQAKANVQRMHLRRRQALLRGRSVPASDVQASSSRRAVILVSVLPREVGRGWLLRRPDAAAHLPVLPRAPRALPAQAMPVRTPLGGLSAMHGRGRGSAGRQQLLRDVPQAARACSLRPLLLVLPGRGAGGGGVVRLTRDGGL
jgi:hypothetical protein